MDPISLAGAYQCLKTAEDLTTVFDAKVDCEVKPKIVEAQVKLVEVQDARFMLGERLYSRGVRATTKKYVDNFYMGSLGFHKKQEIYYEI